MKFKNATEMIMRDVDHTTSTFFFELLGDEVHQDNT